MKTLLNILENKFLVKKNINNTYKYSPKIKKELQNIIKNRIDSTNSKCNLNDIDVSHIKDMSHLFEGVDMTNINISNWDVSNVINMGNMFRAATINKLDLSAWNTHNVIYMNQMFMSAEFNCTNDSFNNWDVSNVETFARMFEDTQFEGLISKWDVNSAKDMNSMFYGDNLFNCNLSTWNPKNCTDMGSMFAYCQKFNSNIDNWDVSKVTNMNDTFLETELSNKHKLPKWHK